MGDETDTAGAGERRVLALSWRRWRWPVAAAEHQQPEQRRCRSVQHRRTATATDASAARRRRRGRHRHRMPGRPGPHRRGDLADRQQTGRGRACARSTCAIRARIVRTARECHVAAGIMTMKVGIEGRVITGPAGGPGTVDVPLRIAVVQEGIKAEDHGVEVRRVPVTVASASRPRRPSPMSIPTSRSRCRAAGDIDGLCRSMSASIRIGAASRSRRAKRKPAAGKPKRADTCPSAACASARAERDGPRSTTRADRSWCS